MYLFNGFPNMSRSKYETNISEHVQSMLGQGEGKHLSVTNKANIFAGEYSLQNFQGRYYAKSQNLARLLTNMIENAMDVENVDVLICPTVDSLPNKLPISHEDMLEHMEHALGHVAITSIFNITGQPALTVPTKYSSKEQLPIGMQIVSKRWNDEQCIKVGHVYEQLRGPLKNFSNPKLN